jgi:hypothetical protein
VGVFDQVFWLLNAFLVVLVHNLSKKSKFNFIEKYQKFEKIYFSDRLLTKATGKLPCKY